MKIPDGLLVKPLAWLLVKAIGKPKISDKNFDRFLQVLGTVSKKGAEGAVTGMRNE